MRNIKLTIEYDGGRYYGWQRLGKDEPTNTIENKLLEVIRKMTGENIDIFCGARTENGVHAIEQIANFKTNSDMSPLEIKHYFNRYLPRDIAVSYVEEVDERFHASLNAAKQTYQYRISIGDYAPVFNRKFTYYCFGELNIERMQEAADLLKGKHEFKGFSTVKRTNKSTEREIYDLSITGDQKEIQITICANDFLHNMARIIVGILIEIGEGELESSILNEIIASKTRNEEIEMADPKGLALLKVEY